MQRDPAPEKGALVLICAWLEALVYAIAHLCKVVPAGSIR